MTIGPAIGPIALRGAAFFSTHHASAADVLAGRARPVTAPAFALLVGRARRFTSLVTQMHLEVCGALGHDAADPPLAVFATCHGEIQTAEKLVTDFRDAAMVSSARFAVSVHNTASGMYSVAVGSTAATTTVTGSNAIAAGWLEAALTVLDTGRSVLLSIADEPVPAIFQGPSEPAGVAAAFLLGPGNGRGVELVITPLATSSITSSIRPSATPSITAAAPIDALHVLARVADGATRDAAAPVVLGPIQPGAVLELRFPPQATRA